MISVRGIGEETIADIKRNYPNIGELKEALKKDKVSLRNDIVISLKKLFHIS